MGEPIVLFNRAGQTLHVYTRSQADALIDGGEWFMEPPAGDAGEAVEAEPVAEDAPPAPPAPKTKTSKRPARAKGGDL